MRSSNLKEAVRKIYSGMAMMNRYYSLICILFVSTIASATTHTIRFGGGFGSVYEPKKLNVAVGDTIIWRGDFLMHPLSSTSVPSGAESFHHSDGIGITAFKYVVEVAGDYAYKCDVHGSSGMTGTFTATQAAVGELKVFADDVKAFPGQGVLKLQFQLANTSQVSARMLDHLGRTLNELRTACPAGTSECSMNTSGIGSGTYFLDIHVAGAGFLRRITLIQ